ncbi:MAG: hypothetical protein H7Z14_03130 [Anaerolineae bacterium]|nr:hypothetical protein [Phycisphaerae bacterium]
MSRKLPRFALITLLGACGFAIPRATFAQSVPKSTDGLNSLSDDALLDELAVRGMDSLLDRAFVVSKASPEKQASVRTLVKLRQLGDPSTRLSLAQRQALVAEIVKSIDLALPSMRDPKLMMRQAGDLLAAGVERDVNTLEYWGDNPRTQAQLRPVVQTVVKLLERAQAESTRIADESADKIKSPDDKAAVARYEQFEQLAREAEYTKYMTDYDLVLAIDKADPRRREIAGKASEFLKQYDVPEQPIRARVKTRLGKFALASGDLNTARSMFDAVSKADAKDFPQPPDIGLQYEARYFRAVTDLTAQNTDAAMKALDDLEAWQRANLPDPNSQPNAEARERAKNAQEGASAAAAMLRYRILALQSDLAGGAVKKQKNDEAVAVLYALLKQQPGLQGIIYEQLMSKLPENAPMSSMDALLLQALVRRGESELRRGENAAADRKTLDRALQAARELTTRAKANPASVEPQLLDSSTLLTGFFLDKLGQREDATAALLDFIVKFPLSKNRELALDNAQALLGQLRRDKPEDEKVGALYERFLPVAIKLPFNRRQFAYEYARRLQLQNKPKEAIEFFRLVPDDDKRALAAHFFQTVALQQQLDELPPGDPNRAALVSEIQTLADQVKSQIGAAMASASDPEERNNYRSMLSRVALLAAEMARTEQRDPVRALALLEKFEDSIIGLPDANRRMTDALLIRVQSRMALGQLGDATNELVQLLDKEPTRGGRIVYDLLQNLNAELDKAQAAGKAEVVRAIARDRAALTGFLVNWAKDNKNDAVKKLTYGYAVFDAEVQRFAATHEEDSEKRKAGLEKARARFVELNDADSIALYRATLPPNSANELTAYDASVVMGLARTQFDLGQFTEARDSFSRLLNDRRLGPPVMIVEEKGAEREVDNDNYWEAVLKLIRSNLALNTGIDESKNYLKQQLIRWGDRAGGKKWKKDFEQLRSEIIPGYDPNAIPPPTTTPSTIP